MRNARMMAVLGVLAASAAAGTAGAATIVVNANIAKSTTWTANNTYDLAQQIYVLPGATLTIEAGTVIATTPTPNGSGSLAVTPGAQIFVNGTQANPVIMTSTADVATWTGGDPKTGTWREAANEWGNLTLLGRGLISGSHFAGQPIVICGVPNTKTPTGLNRRQMEGLVAQGKCDNNVYYGGDDDDDDSGSISYLSTRYTGRVVGLGNELNGLALGGIGRETDIHHVDIMNNVDDGIEIWGGTVNIKYFNIWNIGDDSFDVDQGWRGQAQFGLIVQGYALDAVQGSGVGDNVFETDGAEDSDAQPVTTSTIYNVTAIGQPIDGDHGTAWRDNARVQYRNCIFMDIGERAVQNDNTDGDGGSGYGFNGTLSFANTWLTDYTHSHNLALTVNGCDDIPGGCLPGDFNYPDTLYTAQLAGKLAEIKDSVFYGNDFASAYTEAIARGVFDPANNNVQEPGSSPIAGITRQMVEFCVDNGDCPAGTTCVGGICEFPGGIPFPGQSRGGKIMQRVTSLDPRAANDAEASVGAAPNNGFFTPAQYRGAFGVNENWLCGWTAADAFGFVVAVPCPADLSGNGTVDTVDFLALLQAWGGPGGDLNCDGTTNTVDFLALLQSWGPCP